MNQNKNHGPGPDNFSPHAAHILENIHDSVIISDLNGDILIWNHGAESILGYAAEEIIGRPISILYPADEIARIAAVRDVLMAGRTVTNLEVTELRKDGSRVNILLNIIPLLGADGKPILFAGIGTDITALKELETKKREAEKLTVIQATTIALHHHLNQRLTSLALELSLLRRYLPRDAVKLGGTLDKMETDLEGIKAILDSIASLREARMEPYLGETNMLSLEKEEI